jgi:cation diffusion facilitator family transporter
VEALGAFVSIILIWVLYGMLIEESIGGIIEGGHEMDIGIMFVLSVCAFLLNILKICIAGGHSHGGGGGGKGGHAHGGGKGQHGAHDAKKTEHSHGGKSHGEHGAKKEEEKEEEIAPPDAAGIKVAFINLFGDVLKSFGIICLSVVLWKWDHLGILDPIYTLVVSILVIISTFGLTKDTFKILIEAVPENVDMKKLISEIKGIPGLY